MAWVHAAWSRTREVGGMYYTHTRPSELHTIYSKLEIDGEVEGSDRPNVRKDPDAVRAGPGLRVGWDRQVGEGGDELMERWLEQSLQRNIGDEWNRDVNDAFNHRNPIGSNGVMSFTPTSRQTQASMKGLETGLQTHKPSPPSFQSFQEESARTPPTTAAPSMASHFPKPQQISAMSSPPNASFADPSALGATPASVQSLPSALGATPASMQSLPSALGATPASMQSLPTTHPATPATVQQLPTTANALLNGATPTAPQALPTSTHATAPPGQSLSMTTSSVSANPSTLQVQSLPTSAPVPVLPAMGEALTSSTLAEFPSLESASPKVGREGAVSPAFSSPRSDSLAPDEMEALEERYERGEISTPRALVKKAFREGYEEDVPPLHLPEPEAAPETPSSEHHLEQKGKFVDGPPEHLDHTEARDADTMPMYHNFDEVRRQGRPRMCEYCSHTVWPGQKAGYCSECRMFVHSTCKSKVSHHCAGNAGAKRQSIRKRSAFLSSIQDKLEEGHNHQFYLKHFDKFTYCNVCRSFMMGLGKQGYCCEICQLACHEKCLEGGVNFTCKYPNVDNEIAHPKAKVRHHWVEGNCPVGASCTYCGKSISARKSARGLMGWKCSWCQQCVHSTCRKNPKKEKCDLGPLRNIILPPNCVWPDPTSTEKVVWRVKAPPNPDWAPLIVFVNPKSGGQQGERLFRKFKRLLNPLQVCNLSEGGPRPGLERFANLPHIRILGCGGDGTIGWILSILDTMSFPKVSVGILPLGTGNDLARVLGWGGGYSGGEISSILEQMRDATTCKLDRWAIEVTPHTNGGEDGDTTVQEKKVHIMNNYCSIGVDAKVALEFHNQRENNPDAFKSRLGNKIKYAKYGAEVMVGEKYIHEIIEVKVNGDVVSLPQIQGLIILNIPSYAGGSDLWGAKTGENDQGAAIDDGILEIVGIENTFHMGNIKAKLSKAIRINQAHSVEIKYLTDDQIAFQIDGEPWLQDPATISIGYHKEVEMMKKKLTSVTGVRARLNSLGSWRRRSSASLRSDTSNDEVATATTGDGNNEDESGSISTLAEEPSSSSAAGVAR